MNNSDSEKAFTLIELLIVIAIIAILSVIGITNFTGAIKNARDAQRKSDLNAITMAYETHYTLASGYLPLQDSWFAANKIPTPPEGGSYLGLISAPSLIGFEVCATLENNTTLCKSSSQIAYSGAAPTIPPASTSVPIPSSSSIPTPTAPIVDTSTTAMQNSGTTISFSKTSGSLTDGLVVVGLAYRAQTNPSAHASSVTYGGSAMTYLPGSRVTNSDRATEIWYKTLGNTSNGSNTVSVTMSADPEDLVVGATTYKSVDQTSPVGVSVTNFGSTVNESVSIPTGTNDTAYAVLSIYPYGSTNTSTTSSPAVQRWKNHSGSNNIEGTASEISNASAGTTVISWTSSQGPTWAASGVAIKPSLNPQPSVTPTPVSTTVPIAKTTYNLKVLAIGFDPADGSGDLDTKYFSSSWGSYGASSATAFEDAVFSRAIQDFKDLSGNYINYQIAQKIRITQFPTYDNGFQFSVNSYANCFSGGALSNGLTCDQQKGHFDTGAWFAANNICQTAASIGADEIWIIGAPWIMIWEDFMVGPTYGFPVNGGVYTIPACTKHYYITNPTYDRPGLLLHSYAHRVEATMNYLTQVWNSTDTQNYWENFAIISRYGSGSPTTGCGNAHFPLNASAGYDTSNSTTKTFNCPDWKNFPQFTGATESINCSNWGCDDPGWQKHWLGSIPSSADAIHMTGANGEDIIFRKDWWYYILNADNAIAFHNNPSVLGASTSYSQYLVPNVFEKLIHLLLQLIS